jgi:hypothetical protein
MSVFDFNLNILLFLLLLVELLSEFAVLGLVVIDSANKTGLLLLKLDDFLLNLLALNLGHTQLIGDILDLVVLLFNFLEFLMKVSLAGFEALAQLLALHIGILHVLTLIL